MKGSPAKLGTIQGTAGHASALKMKMEEKSAAKLRAKKAALKMKMEKDSPAKIPLKGKQHNLPEELKAKIKASPGKMKKDSPMDMKKESPTKILGAVAKVAGKVGKAVGKVDEASVKYDFGKVMKLVKSDKFLQRAFKTVRGNDKKKAEIIFKNFIMGDKKIEKGYKKL